MTKIFVVGENEEADRLRLDLSAQTWLAKCQEQVASYNGDEPLPQSATFHLW